MNSVKLSIITVNLNNLEGLKKTYESVVCQTFTDYEWIVIDGAPMEAVSSLNNIKTSLPIGAPNQTRASIMP